MARGSLRKRAADALTAVRAAMHANDARLAGIEARDQAMRHEGESFDSIEALMADLHA